MNPTNSEDSREAARQRAKSSIALYRKAYGNWESDLWLAVIAIADLTELIADKDLPELIAHKDLPQLGALEFSRRKELEQQDLERRELGAERKEWRSKRRWVPARTLIGWANLHCRRLGLPLVDNGEDAAARIGHLTLFGLTGETRTVE